MAPGPGGARGFMDQRNDMDVIKNGRTSTLKDTDELKVVVPLRDQIVDKLVRKLEEQGEGIRTKEIWDQGNSLRQDWLKKQEELLATFDEFVEPIYDATNDWSSTLHLPIVFTMCKTMHARFLAALLGIDPPFTLKARTAANMDRAQLIQEFVRYTLASWANRYQGIEAVADAWLWRWVTAGRGILKNRWERSFTRFIDVIEREVVVGAMTTVDEEGNLVAIPTKRKIEEEKDTVIETFNGPMVEFVPTEDVLIVGGNDPQEADHVIHSTYMTASQLWSLVDQGVFRKEAVELIIESGESYRGKDATNSYKIQQAVSSGQSDIDSEIDEKRYQILERYSRIDVDGSGIASDIILWVHGETGQICKATYLYRVSRTGLRPFFSIDFHIRENGQPAGLPELLYSLAKEIDAMHNMKVDFGLISSMPMGFYRASSSLQEEKMPLEPGSLIPLDNPQTDIYFPNLGNRGAFAGMEEQQLQAQIERMTSISDLSLGIVGGQGAARTATGARALLGESNANLDVYLRRMNRGWKRMLVHLFHMLQDRTPDGMQFRVTGDDGQLYWETIKSRQELQGMFDFELEANSANSNKQVTIEQASTVLQTISNPFFIQLGIAGPVQLYNAVKNLFQHMGVKDFSKYITKPQGAQVIYTPEEIANATLAGVNIKMGPEQDLQGFIDYFQHIADHDELLGQFNEQQTIALARKAMEAQSMLRDMQAQAAQVANAQQMSMNASMGSSPSPQGAGQANAAPPQQQAPPAEGATG